MTSSEIAYYLGRRGAGIVPDNDVAAAASSMRGWRRIVPARSACHRQADSQTRGASYMAVLSNLAIAQQASLKPIEDVAGAMGIGSHLLEPYGRDVMKIDLEAIEELADRPRAKYVVVSAITPTPLGEGKTTTTVGLGQGLTRIGRPAVVAIRQASMGPALGIKGGAAGGGYSQVVPMEKLNLHLTGDMHAVTAAHNQLAAMVDSHLFHGNKLGLDPDSITWRRGR
jgi:formate--tetrahydrofolate ligase